MTFLVIAPYINPTKKTISVIPPQGNHIFIIRLATELKPSQTSCIDQFYFFSYQLYFKLFFI